MTGYTVHTGSTEKFAAGWDEIFRRGAGQKSAVKKPAVKKPAVQKSSGKTVKSKGVSSSRKKKR